MLSRDSAPWVSPTLAGRDRFALPAPDQLSAAASIGFLSLPGGLKAQITQQSNANGVLKLDLPKTVINAPLCNRARLHTVGGMTRVCVVGSVNMDIGFDVDTLPHPGETVLAASFRSTPGGKGANQAVAAARAGARVQFVGAVGDDPAAAALREHLTANGVGTDGLITVPGPSGSAVIVVDSAGENTHRRRAGRQWSPDAGLRRAAWARRRLRCAVAAVGDSGHDGDSGRPRGAFGRSDRHRQRLTVRRRSRPAGRAGEATDVVVVNEAEAGAMALAGPTSSDHPRRAAAPAMPAATRSSP